MTRCKLLVPAAICAVLIGGAGFVSAYTGEELEKEKGGSGLRYSFDIKNGGVTHEVGIDAKTGKLLENSAEGPHADWERLQKAWPLLEQIKTAIEFAIKMGRQQGAYRNWYTTEEQRSCRPVFIATLWAAPLLTGATGTWGIESNVIERFAGAGIPAEKISFARDNLRSTIPAPAALVDEFRKYYGTTMNAFEVDAWGWTPTRTARCQPGSEFCQA
jgi:hypothetical protein